MGNGVEDSSMDGVKAHGPTAKHTKAIGIKAVLPAGVHTPTAPANATGVFGITVICSLTPKPPVPAASFISLVKESGNMSITAMRAVFSMAYGKAMV